MSRKASTTIDGVEQVADHTVLSVEVAIDLEREVAANVDRRELVAQQLSAELRGGERSAEVVSHHRRHQLGLIGFFNFNLVDAIVGGRSAEETSAVSRICYAIVGLCAIVVVMLPPLRGRRSFGPRSDRQSRTRTLLVSAARAPWPHVLALKPDDGPAPWAVLRHRAPAARCASLHVPPSQDRGSVHGPAHTAAQPPT